MPNYQLVNPYIVGDFKTVFSGKTPHDAAQRAWDSLADHLRVTETVPRFGFTLERLSDKKLSHFVIKENMSNSDSVVDYKISEHSVDLSDKEVKGFRNRVDRLRDQEQEGGRRERKKDDDDSDSSDELYDLDVYKKYLRQNQPLMYFWYDPIVYRLDSIVLPTFYGPFYPVYHIGTYSMFY